MKPFRQTSMSSYSCSKLNGTARIVEVRIEHRHSTSREVDASIVSELFCEDARSCGVQEGTQLFWERCVHAAIKEHNTRR